MKVVTTSQKVIIFAVLLTFAHPLKPFKSSAKICTSQKFGKIEMSLHPMPIREFRVVVPRRITLNQMNAYWGMNKNERLAKFLESLLLSYGGVWISWFLSAMAGNIVSAIIGTMLIFNWMYTPWLYAKRRVTAFSPKPNTHYALFIGNICTLSKLRRKGGKSVGALSKEYLSLTAADDEGRELEIITQWQANYDNLERDARLCTILMSPTPDFSSITAMTDAWVVDGDIWVGDFPYVDKQRFKEIFATKGSAVSPIWTPVEGFTNNESIPLTKSANS